MEVADLAIPGRGMGVRFWSKAANASAEFEFKTATATATASVEFKFKFKFKTPSREEIVRFDPERLAVYRLARAHTRAVREMIEAANTRGFANLVGQLRDAAASITANILEGQGEWRLGKQAHYLYIAKGSTWECWGHTDSFVDFGLVPVTGIARIRDLQNQITALLITMLKNLEARIRERRKERRAEIERRRGPRLRRWSSAERNEPAQPGDEDEVFGT